MSNGIITKPYYILLHVIIVIIIAGLPPPPSTAALTPHHTWFNSDSLHCNRSDIIKCDGPNLIRHLDLSKPCTISPLHTPLPRLIPHLTSLRRLNLSGCAFSGDLPPEFYNLTELESLDLSSNKLSGQLLPNVARMKKLRQLILDGNGFSGRLPEAIGRLTELEELSLNSNSFSGFLPPEIGGLRRLESLDISCNFFSGGLPRSLSNLTKLAFFSAKHNFFSGNLFEEIMFMKSLQILDISSNSFTGNIPSGIGDLKNVGFLDIAGNDWDSEVPESIGRLTNLVYLIASNSRLRGEIPPNLGNCMKMEVLDLSFNSLHGRLPDELAGLRSIRSLLLDSNRLSGAIPPWISHWTTAVSLHLSQNLFTGTLPTLPPPSLLRYFDASDNMITGELNPNICKGIQSNLATLILSRNKISGAIGDKFTTCFSLRDLILSENNISGEIPGYLGKLRLITLEIEHNRLTGSIPDQLWESKTLMAISFNNNFLHGSLPAAVAKVTNLRRLQLDGNLLTGSLPSSIGKLRNLTNLSLNGNKLTGAIPSQIFECRSLVSLDLGGNSLSGEIPRSISKLENLVLSHNRLTGAIPEEICSGFKKSSFPDSEFKQHYGMLDLSYNELEGPIPPTIKNCIVVREINLDGNKLNGSIPEEIWSIPNLTVLHLSSNSLSSFALPSFFPQFMSLQGLFLSHNQLRGSIPDDIGLKLPRLAKIDLSFNYFTGQLPPSLFGVKGLEYLDVSMNSLSGRLDGGGGGRGRSSLLVLNVSNNHMSGEVDDSVSNLASLSVLDLHNNDLSGCMPPAISALDSLTFLDISGNRFQDSFPCNICSIRGLNNGDFPCSFVNDSSLSSPRFHLHAIAVAVAIIAVSAAVIAVILLAGVLKWETRREKEDEDEDEDDEEEEIAIRSEKKAMEPVSINIAVFEHSLCRLEAAEISSATENFSSGYVIGDGGFGTVYKASLAGGRTIAVKRLNGGHNREFFAEMETVGKVKHANLVPLLGYCVLGDERLLIYEYMENGSLDRWLRKQGSGSNTKSSPLDWPKRFNICMGSARGLAFLHHGFVPHIIHRDIKSSNILLDSDFEARLSDFGLARIISACESHVSTALAGTSGYVPPEYGQAMVATTKGDVYSFGVVVMEVVTGRPPTGQADGEGGNLVGWVRLMVAAGKAAEALDACWCGVAAWNNQMLRVLAVAMACTNDQPAMRPTMCEVVKLLKEA